MGLEGKLELVMEMKSSGDKYWNGLMESTTLFPKIFPQHYKSIQVVEGDGKSVGTIKKIVYGVPTETEVTEKVILVEEAKKTATYEVIEGDVLKFFKTFNVTTQVDPKGDGCNVKWSIQYDKVSEEVPEPNEVAEIAKKVFTDLDDYLVKN